MKEPDRKKMTKLSRRFKSRDTLPSIVGEKREREREDEIMKDGVDGDSSWASPFGIRNSRVS